MKIVSTLFLLLLLSSANAQINYPEFEKQQYTNNGDTLLYRILYPLNYSEDEIYPLILFLHGAGERGSDNELQLVHGAALFADSSVRTKYPAFVIFPQCPVDKTWAGYKINHGADSATHRLYLEPNTPFQRPLQLVKLLLDSLSNARQVDKKRIYIGGLSMGGFGTFDMLQRYPDFFSAAFPICGGGIPADAIKYAKNVTMWVFHGAKDNVVNPGLSRNMVAALKAAGGNVKYTEYPEANHNSWDSAFAEPQLFSWLFSQSRK